MARTTTTSSSSANKTTTSSSSSSKTTTSSSSSSSSSSGSSSKSSSSTGSSSKSSSSSGGSTTSAYKEAQAEKFAQKKTETSSSSNKSTSSGGSTKSDTSAYWSTQPSSSSTGSSSKSSSSTGSSSKSSSSSGGSTTSAYKEAQAEKFAQKKAEASSSSNKSTSSGGSTKSDTSAYWSTQPSNKNNPTTGGSTKSAYEQAQAEKFAQKKWEAGQRKTSSGGSAKSDTSAYWSTQPSNKNNPTTGGSTKRAYEQAQAEKFAQKKWEAEQRKPSSGGNVKSDTSAYWQAQRDRDVYTATKYKNEKSDTSAYWQNLNVSATTEEQKRMKILEFKEKQMMIQMENENLEKAAKDLINAAGLLNNSTSGAKSKNLWDRIVTAVENLNKDGEKNNKLLDEIEKKLKELGENIQINGKYKGTETPSNKNKDDTYKWYSNIIPNVVDLINDAVGALKNINNQSVNDTQKDIQNVNKDLENANKSAEETEKQNSTLLQGIKDGFSNAKEGISNWWDETVNDVNEWWDDTVDGVKDSWNDLWDGDNNTNKNNGNGGFVIDASAAELGFEERMSNALNTKKEYKTPNKLSDENEREIKETLINGETVTIQIYGDGRSRVEVTKDGMVRVYAPAMYNEDGNSYVEYLADEFFNDVLPYAENYHIDASTSRKISF